VPNKKQKVLAWINCDGINALFQVKIEFIYMNVFDQCYKFLEGICSRKFGPERK
jgi:hypothetical protein